MNEKEVQVDMERVTEKKSIWMRFLYMLLYVMIMQVVKGLIFLLALVQFIFTAVGKTPNKPLQEFGQGLSTYLYDMNQFLFFNSEFTPFPFAGWNNGPPQDVCSVREI